ncbi:hypothetical protein HN51_038813 [Arachis hypogaea]|uniref:Uncharacterized protein n=1 Tax=Arachis hypogaea TaxID=3818 RepID=A0A444YGW6_ARAHY|nr:uncharacterized protein LOC107645170 [Arachis ipaensis]XP_025662437.1 uncharacterized protein LOC112758076 [Arachis hypogaea]QHN84240.1 uncharacterized protein DS421_16g526920 [Arachis hypogaea]RYR01144.1 hypothetical protein Ahy_B06g079987 [Arachis hypogaea]
MATSLDTPSPSPSPVFSPSSDKRFWSTLQSRIDTLLGGDSRRKFSKAEEEEQTLMNEGAKRMKEDSMLLMRGFDSVAHTLSQLSNNLDNALQGAKELANPPTLTDIFHSKFDKVRNKEESSGEEEKEIDESKQGTKRKFDHNDVSEENAGDGKQLKDRMIKRAKNIALSMATKAASLARELKSIKSDLSFMQERCVLLEEENRRLRDGFAKGVRPEEDDLVRLQLEALLAEKSRLANENANLVRENQCLHQLVEYHQLASQDISESYENVIQGMCLDFSSPPAIAEETRSDDDDKSREPTTPKSDDPFQFSTKLDEFYDEV